MENTSSRDRLLRLRKVLMKDFLLLAALAMIAEGILRYYAPEYGRMFTDFQYTRGHPYDFDSKGFRGPLPRIEKKKREFRVLALGDSTTFGTGVASEAVWPRRLEEKLKVRSGRPVSVINGALEGAAFRDLVYTYDRTWVDYKPDWVVVAVYANMVADAWIRRNAPDRPPWNGRFEYASTHSTVPLKTRLNRLLHRVCLPSALLMTMHTFCFQLGLQGHHLDPSDPKGFYLAYGWKQGDIPGDLPLKAWDVLEGEILRMKEKTAARGSRLLLTFLPCRFSLSDRWTDNDQAFPKDRFTMDPVEKTRRICRSLGIPFVNVLSALRKRRAKLEAAGISAPMYILGDYGHLNDEGHLAVADALAAFLGDAMKKPGSGGKEEGKK